MKSPPERVRQIICALALGDPEVDGHPLQRDGY
jgi:hypothetical protein